jgi:hypothetical protein
VPTKPHLAELVEIAHRCDCKTAVEAPGQDGVEHVFRVDGADFPWHISEGGPVVTRLGDDLYTVAVEFYARRVDAVGVEVRDDVPG